jgi:hypothetical protein
VSLAFSFTVMMSLAFTLSFAALAFSFTLAALLQDATTTLAGIVVICCVIVFNDVVVTIIVTWVLTTNAALAVTVATGAVGVRVSGVADTSSVIVFHNHGIVEVPAGFNADVSASSSLARPTVAFVRILQAALIVTDGDRSRYRRTDGGRHRGSNRRRNGRSNRWAHRSSRNDFVVVAEIDADVVALFTAL